MSLLKEREEPALSLPRIVSAATIFRKPDGSTILIASPRHFDATCRSLLAELKEPVQEVEQGFVDQHGVFWSRLAAWSIAHVGGQIRRRVGGDERGYLYSENLY